MQAITYAYLGAFFILLHIILLYRSQPITYSNIFNILFIQANNYSYYVKSGVVVWGRYYRAAEPPHSVAVFQYKWPEPTVKK